MKILIEKEDRIRPDSTCVYFQRAFEKIADTVTVYPEELPLIKPGMFDLHVRIDYGVDNPFPADLHPSAYYAIDTHIHANWRVEMAKKAQFDYIFMAQKQGLELPWHTQNKYWLPLACEPDTHTVQGKRFKKYDVCFIGNTQPGWQPRRIERLDKLFKAFPNFYFGNKFFKEASEIYAESRIVFNSSLSNDINMRFFEGMASGSCLATDTQDWKGLGFEPGKHFIEYNDDNMIDKVKWFLDHDGVREHVAQEGQKEVLENHTYLKRAQVIYNTCLGKGA